jgi:predicted glycosyltransferase
MPRRRLLLYSSDQRGPGTLCGGVRIAAEALRQVRDLCVLAITDTPGVGTLMPTRRFDHVLLPPLSAANRNADALRAGVFQAVLSSFRPDLVVALRPTAADPRLLQQLAEERRRRPDLRTALALWDVPGESEIEALTTDPGFLIDLFDEMWSFGDPTVHDRRSYLPPSLADNLVDLGYVTYAATGVPMAPVSPRVGCAPRISISLGTGWLALDALGALRAALDRPGLRALSRELVPNAVLGRRRSARLAEVLGIGLHRNAPSIRHLEHEVVVSTGGYNSVCATLSTSATPVLVHDTRFSSAGVRSAALSNRGICSDVDLAASEPADIEAQILDAVERPSASHGLRSGGATMATDRMLNLLRSPGVPTPVRAGLP